MKSINLVFPHQLFQNTPFLESKNEVYIVEEYLFFNQYNFHKQKIAYHRATMKSYEFYLKSKNIKVVYIEATSDLSDIRKLIPFLKNNNVEQINYIDTVDDYLNRRIDEVSINLDIKTKIYDTLMFLNSEDDLKVFFRKDKKKYHQTSFYTDQRKLRGILLEKDGKPVGGKWTFDTENRKKYPAKKVPPIIYYPDADSFYNEAMEYVNTNFAKNLGELSSNKLYPTNFEESNKWLTQFFEYRFTEFGPYEDAIVKENSILNHSVLTPMLNTGLLTPDVVLSKSLEYAKQNNIPINSLEGFVRQIMGWREFIRGMYISRGSDERTKNYWGFSKKIPKSFYDGTTGIAPLDLTIRKALKTGYCNHIERLMILGNFMMLCEFDPDEVYRWFMELFIDGYDWVMVPNIYGMSQFSDGGLMASKPYISGSNYLKKMSNFKKGPWQEIWDGLFWRYMDKHRVFFKSNPRLGMLVSMFDKMPLEKRALHLKNAELYLEKL